MTKNEEEDESFQRIQTINDISIDRVGILEHDGKRHLPKLVELKEKQKGVVVQFHDSVFSLSIHQVLQQNENNI